MLLADIGVLSVYMVTLSFLLLLIIILEDIIAYKGGIINLKIELIQLTIKGRQIKISFNILLLGRDKAILEML